MAPYKNDLTYCSYHHEHLSRIERCEMDIQDLWKSIDRMKTWVILGSGSMILALIAIVANFAITYVNKENTQIQVLSEKQITQIIRSVNNGN